MKRILIILFFLGIVQNIYSDNTYQNCINDCEQSHPDSFFKRMTCKAGCDAEAATWQVAKNI